MSAKVNLSLHVNGQRVDTEVDPAMSLLRFLREDLGLVGAKNGCEKGHCGACTVIVDGVARRACVLKASRMNGASILTIEGLREHPLQRSFVHEGAVQCGFCTPGMIMAAKALLDKVPDPTDAQIAEALKDNMCRCTGYAAIKRAIARAAKELRGGEAKELGRAGADMPAAGAVGRSVARKDAPAKTRGDSLFAEDLADRYLRDGLGRFERGGAAGHDDSGARAKPLVGKMLFSERGHARLLAIDVSAAARAEGVALVLTAKDVPGLNAFGLFVPQQPVIAGTETLYLGDVVAVVLAESRELAEAARSLISVDYEDLPLLSSPEENLKEGSALVHPEAASNVVHETHVRKSAAGFESALVRAQVVIANDYETQPVEHAYLEPESCLAIPDADGGVTVYTGNQGSGDYRDMIAASLALPKDKVRVVLVACGGGFGGKEEPTVQIQAALGAVRSGRPVRMTLSREESIRTSTKRHPMRIRMCHAASSDGKLLAVESRAVADAGAYVSQTGPVVFRSAVTATGPYTVDAVIADSYGVYTHANPSGAFRGFGSTQVSFACEVQMDEVARALGMDPIELRRRNAFAPGKRTGTGQVLDEGVGYLGTLEAAARALDRMRAEFGAAGARGDMVAGKRIGFGVASSYKNVGIGTGLPDGAGAMVELGNEGRVVVRTGAADMGQGSDTVAAQIAAEELGVPYDLVDVVACDTRSCPEGGMTTASRQTFVTGNAVKLAAGELAARLAAYLPGEETWLGLAAESEGTATDGGAMGSASGSASAGASAARARRRRSVRRASAPWPPVCRSSPRRATSRQPRARTAPRPSWSPASSPRPSTSTTPTASRARPSP